MDQHAPSEPDRDITAALRQILQVIGASRDDEAPVFEVILENACRLCDAPFAGLYLLDPARREITLVASLGARSAYLTGNARRWPIDDPASVGIAIREGRIVQAGDIRDTDAYRQGNRQRVEAADIEGIRTFLAVPLIHAGVTIGAIGLYRREVAPFSDPQIALVETFADQAVIAIENVRQFREVQTRLEREKASREILQVISASRTDPAPVFDVILQNAAQLSGAPSANLCILNAARSHWQLVAHFGDGLRHLAVGKTTALSDSKLLPAVAMRTARVAHIEDLTETDLYRQGDPGRVAMVDEEGMRTIVCVPLLDGAEAMGSITLFRREVAPFTDDEIALVETFAAQAVIAIENVRQFREVQTRLERESATREILQVISQSREDDMPVFEKIAEQASRLCDAPLVGLALVGDMRDRIRQVGGVGPRMGQYLPGEEFLITPGSADAAVIEEAQTLHFHDVTQEPDSFGDEENIARMAQLGIRTRLSVPLLLNSQTIGLINLNRTEVRPFSQSEITLVQTFAAQAVIAIENVRQFREVQTRLEREKASREVLDVISRSRDDESPVFDTILENAARLCHAPLAALSLISEDGRHYTFPAMLGANPDFETFIRDNPPELDPTRYAAARAMVEGRTVQIDDLSDPALYGATDRTRIQSVAQEGVRTAFYVPLISDGRAIGAICLYRREVRAFSPDDIALAESFAAQAVIAIENVRQFREVQTRLEREKASGEILSVISQSRDNETPVLEAIVRNAARLCEAQSVGLSLTNEAGTHLRYASVWGGHHAFFHPDFEFDLDGPLQVARTVREARVIHTPDLADDPLYETRDPIRVKVVEEVGIRTFLTVPLIKDGTALGCLNLNRNEVRPFDDAEITLLETFAAQAVIAIENVRQFRELEKLNAELGERVETQVGEIERMGRLKRFLSPAVADAVVSAGSEDMLQSHRALIATLFADMRGFTAFCETAEPEETIEVLQTFHEEMGRLIHAHGAGVDSRAGDGIMVIMGDPLPLDDPAGDALNLALAMRDRMAELATGWRRLGHRLGFGVGLSLGYATVGMVGSDGRYDYTASGTAVNLAARLCDHAADGEILLSPRACMAVEDRITAESMGERDFKGIKAPVEVFRVAGPKA